MYARTFTVQVSPDKLDDFIHLWHEAMLPAARGQAGWKSARLLVDRKTGKAMVVGIWETEAEAMATGGGSAYAQGQVNRISSLITAPPVVEHYEVAGDA
jgi:heme-degrading monooxygenase HmoA